MSRKHRVLIVGVGSIGERHLRCFAATGRAEVSLCETNPNLRQTIADRYRVVDVFCDYDSALGSRPEIILIATPAHLHIPMASAAVRAGAHVFIEKPLSTSTEGIAGLQELVTQHQSIAGVAYVYRSHPGLAGMRDAIREGLIGTPVELVANCGQHFPFYRPAYRDIYYRDRATGGGAVQDALTHIINAAEWLVGPVTRVVSDLDHKVLEGVTVEDTVHVLTRHADVMGSYSLNQHQAPNELTLTVIGTRGTIRFESHHSRWRWQQDPGGTWTDVEFSLPERDTLFIRQANLFLDAIEQRSAPQCEIGAGLQTLKVNLAILRSAERGAWETVDAT